MQMTQAQLIRKLHSLTPDTNYGELLQKEFGVEVPDNALAFQKEYLYKYCLQAASKGMTGEELLAKAAKEVEVFTEKFPWVKNKGNEESQIATKQPKAGRGGKRKTTLKVDAKSKTGNMEIKFNDTTEKWEGIVEGVVVAARKSRNSIRRMLAAKYKYEE